MSKKTTTELLHILSSVRTPAELQDYTDFLSKEHISYSFSEYISQKLHEKNISAAQLIRASQLQRNYGYQILNGTRMPSRDKVLALCLALSLDLNETQRALACSQNGMLYSKNKRDSILIFSIKKNLSVMETNDLLAEMHENALQI